MQVPLLSVVNGTRKMPFKAHLLGGEFPRIRIMYMWVDDRVILYSTFLQTGIVFIKNV